MQGNVHRPERQRDHAHNIQHADELWNVEHLQGNGNQIPDDEHAGYNRPHELMSAVRSHDKALEEGAVGERIIDLQCRRHLPECRDVGSGPLVGCLCLHQGVAPGRSHLQLAHYPRRTPRLGCRGIECSHAAGRLNQLCGQSFPALAVLQVTSRDIHGQRTAGQELRNLARRGALLPLQHRMALQGRHRRNHCRLWNFVHAGHIPQPCLRRC
mmetsp:Transcript_56291/g.132018  ORF Transcript_56291/g.132018 Transcript_56291/m.132018 type:complete len:212 (+) Transcript_56291:1507-2142(+)